MKPYQRGHVSRLSMLMVAIALASAAAGAAADYRMHYKVGGIKPVEPAVSFTTHTFTTCGTVGPIGPSESACMAAYAGAPAEVVGDRALTVTGGIQNWRVPASGTYRIEAAGAGYGAYAYQRGATMAGDFTLQAGQVLKLLVGQKATGAAAGSGGSFVATAANEPLLVAGGSGGANSNVAAIQGTTANLAVQTDTSFNSTPGQGGYCNGCNGRGGGGFYGDGQGGEGGKAFVNGGQGGPLGRPHVGGFGGGGSRMSTATDRAGGGGGYSGGNGTAHSGSPASGSGGGSFNAGANQNNSAGSHLGDGYIKISRM